MNNHETGDKMGKDKYPFWLALSSLICISISGVAAEVTIPAFSDSVGVHSSVSNMQNLALESSLHSALVGSDGSMPAEVHYSFSVSGANKSESGGAIGIVKTNFVVSSLEGWDIHPNVSSKHEWRDSTEVTGTIVNFLKNFDYASGIRV
ncbi:MAG: hypothetical protein CVV33_05915 [Methanomicrobiales archaeon HGW-Methanomicrobiales-4]|nr:MAG: hypothetical protein CVV33_05915 [Methanomicrobiales archaeon HGW-Methanomicrobiales-4]